MIVQKFNRHGYIIGETGTGKTVTIQGLVEKCYDAEMTTIVIDCKGDLSGLASEYPINYITLSRIKLQHSPELLKIALGLNDVQSSTIWTTEYDSVLSLYNEVKDKNKVLHRKLIELNEQGLFGLFGKETKLPLQKDKINLIDLSDYQNNPKVVGLVTLGLIDYLGTYPEIGDEGCKTVLFIDEAYWFFKQLSKEQLIRIELAVRLYRSKGIGLIFGTQIKKDIPYNILANLGLQIEHSTNLSVGNAYVSYIDETNKRVPMRLTQIPLCKSHLGELFLGSGSTLTKVNLDKNTETERSNTRRGRMGFTTRMMRRFEGKLLRKWL